MPLRVCPHALTVAPGVSALAGHEHRRVEAGTRTSMCVLSPTQPSLSIRSRRGWGVQSMTYVRKGTFVMEYAGEVIDDRELRSRMDAARMDGELHYYIMEMGQSES